MISTNWANTKFQINQSLKQSACIVWNKHLIQYKYCFTVKNITIGNIKDNRVFLFNKILILLDGVFAQTSPVLPTGNKALRLNASIQNWVHWHKFKVFHLTEKMGLLPKNLNLSYAEWFAIHYYNTCIYDTIFLPLQIWQRFFKKKSFYNHIFLYIKFESFHINIFTQRAILISWNDMTLTINKRILEAFKRK